MKVKPFDSRWTAVVAGWLHEEENWKWLQFGPDAHKLDPLTFRLMTQSAEHDFLLYYDDYHNQPIGLVAFSEIENLAKTARLWFVLGEKEYAGKGYTRRAVTESLRYAFFDLGLESVYARTVRENEASIEILEKNKFNYIGRRRHCQPIDGELEDQILYDLLATEFVESDIEKYESVFKMDRKIRSRKPAVKAFNASL